MGNCSVLPLLKSALRDVQLHGTRPALVSLYRTIPAVSAIFGGLRGKGSSILVRCSLRDRKTSNLRKSATLRWYRGFIALARPNHARATVVKDMTTDPQSWENLAKLPAIAGTKAEIRQGVPGRTHRTWRGSRR